jgi:hypothetical protein
MPFDLEQFKIQLIPFGTVTYAIIIDEGLETEHLIFELSPANCMYTINNFGVFCTTQILHSYPYPISISMDTIRLKGGFRKNNVN